MTKGTAQDTPPPLSADPFDGLVPGRVVWYHPHEHEVRNVGVAGPWAAIVSMVGDPTWPDTPGLVNLHVLPPKQQPVGVDPVYRMEQVPYSEAPAAGCWSWIFPG